MRSRPLAVFIALVALLAGCGSAAKVEAGRSSDLPSVSSALLRQPDFCSGVLPKMAEARIPAGFRAVAVYDCTTHDVRLAGRGLWSVDDEQRATAGLGRLVDALTRPDQPTPSDISCAAVLVELAPFALVTPGGRLVRPRVPLDECSGPQQATMDALGALHWALVHRTPIEAAGAS